PRCCFVLSSLLRPPPTAPLFPYTPLFRSRRPVRADARPRPRRARRQRPADPPAPRLRPDVGARPAPPPGRSSPGDGAGPERPALDRKSTRLNSSHVKISYAVFCLKQKEPV